MQQHPREECSSQPALRHHVFKSTAEVFQPPAWVQRSIHLSKARSGENHGSPEISIPQKVMI